MVNGATVTATDVPTSNGIIHVIDKVLLPTATPNDIPRTAQCTGIHDSLVAAVVQAELLETLQGDGPFTVFAPTDQAFADAGIDLAALDNEEGKAALTDICFTTLLEARSPLLLLKSVVLQPPLTEHTLVRCWRYSHCQRSNSHAPRCGNEQRSHPRYR